MNKLERTMEEPQTFANESAFLCSAIFPARFLFKYCFASTPTSLAKWLTGCLPHFQFVQVTTYPQKLGFFLCDFSLVAR
jgi:hypothetical protein